MAAVRRPASSRKTDATAAWVVVRLPATLLRMIDDGPDLNGAGPLLGHGEGLVQVAHLDEREAADDLFRLDERAVGHHDFSVLPGDSRRGAWALQLLASDDLASLGVLLEPLAGLLVVRHRLASGSAFELVNAFHRAAEQQNVFHCIPPSGTTNAGGHFRQAATYDPVNSGSCLLRNDMIPIAASVLRAARAKFCDSISSASSSRKSHPRRMASLIIAMANVAAFASRPASSSTAAANSSGATARSTHPTASASLADSRVDSMM